MGTLYNTGIVKGSYGGGMGWVAGWAVTGAVSAGERHNYRDWNLLGRPTCLPPALFHHRSSGSQDAKCVL